MEIENGSHKAYELGSARLSSRIIFSLMADIFNFPELNEVAVCKAITQGESNQFTTENWTITLNLEKSDQVLPINTILEELAHFAHAAVNPNFNDRISSLGNIFDLQGNERNDAFKVGMRDKNMAELFAKVAALHMLRREDVIKAFSHATGMSEQRIKLGFDFAYGIEIARCCEIRRDTRNAHSGMEYMEAYALLAEFPDEAITNVDLAALARMSPDELREAAHQLIGKQNSARISKWYSNLEKTNIDNGFWMTSLIYGRTARSS